MFCDFIFIILFFFFLYKNGDIIDNNKISLNKPKNLLGIYDIEYSYKIDQSMYTLSEEPAYVTVRPFKTLKNGKKVFGAWSSKMILTK